MNVGLVQRLLPKESAARNHLENFAQALKVAGHSSILFTTREAAEAGWRSGEIQPLTGGSAAVFARAVEAANPRGACDFLFSFEPGVACDCFLAATGVQHARMERWSRLKSSEGWFRKPKQGGDSERLALETKSFQPGTVKTIVAGSRMVKDEIVRHYHFPEDRIRVIRDGIPPVDPGTALRGRRESRRRLGLADEDFVIFCGGPELGEQEFRFAVEGINRVNLSQPMLLAGCVQNRATYPRSIRTRFVRPADPDPLAAADVFLQPSIYDPFSHSCLAALAIGLPVITTGANGFSEIIESGTEGEILPDPSDPEAIARAIEAWSDPEIRRAVRPRLLELAGRFDPESNLNALLALLDHCVTTCPSA